MRWLSRLPLRVRLTLAFTGVMAAVLIATGLFLYLRLGNELDGSIEQGLRTRGEDLASLVQASGSGLGRSGGSPLAERGENLAQILDRSGAIIDSTPALRTAPLVSRGAVEEALGDATVFVDIGPTRGTDDPARLLVTSARAGPGGAARVVVVGTPLDDRHDALRNLAALLLIGGPVALLLASLAGYGVAAAALRPVERMSRQAAAIEAAAPAQRLSIPPAHDEIRRLGETLNHMLDRLEDAIERERLFVADASHELRTPLTILKAELDLALSGDRSAAELQSALSSASEETDRLVRLAEDLLVLARVEHGRLAIRREPVDVPDLIRRVAARFARQADERGAELAVGEIDVGTVSADPLRIEQALGNLVDNALRHGGPRVIVTAVEQDGELALHVQDDGPGFSPDFIDEAFERFTREDAARGRGGAGLGLAIVATVARAHGGRAVALNREGGGADVWIVIPPNRGGGLTR